MSTLEAREYEDLNSEQDLGVGDWRQGGVDAGGLRGHGQEGGHA